MYYCQLLDLVQSPHQRLKPFSNPKVTALIPLTATVWGIGQKWLLYMFCSSHSSCAIQFSTKPINKITKSVKHITERALNWKCPSVCLVRRGEDRHWYGPLAPWCDCNQLTAIGGKEPGWPQGKLGRRHTLRPCDPCQCQGKRAKRSTSDTSERSHCLWLNVQLR